MRNRDSVSILKLTTSSRISKKENASPERRGLGGKLKGAQRGFFFDWIIQTAGGFL